MNQYRFTAKCEGKIYFMAWSTEPEHTILLILFIESIEIWFSICL